MALTLLSACNKSEFIETKINSQVGTTSQAEESSEVKLPPGHPPINTNQVSDSSASSAKIEKVQKAKNGITVEEVFLKKTNLKDKSVVLRGKVVKYNSGIMGKNWLHLRDGTGNEGSNDLVVTTSKEVKVNDTVIVNGKMQYDRDIGSGYFFPAIIEDANVTVENK